MEKTKKKAKLFLCISIALMLISMIVSSAVQTNGGDVTIKQLKWETDEGVAISANLYVPSNATAENPAPAVAASHGLYNNKEMQDANFVELARRGYVVVAMDQVGHGNSDLAATNGAEITGNNAVYYSVVMLSRLPYVDASRIGVTGHSMGGMSCNTAVRLDNENETRLISAVLLNSSDATYQSDGEYANIYGSRDVGIIACVYDEFFHKGVAEDGTPLASPHFMEGANAASFLHFGTDATGLEARVSDTLYRETIDGEEAIRVIYRPHIIHPWSHFSTQSTAATINFFEEALGAPNPIDASSQTWLVKEFFNLFGLIGMAMFLVNFTILLLFTPSFASLRAKEIATPAPVDKKGLIWFWGSLAAGAVFSALVYLTLVSNGAAATFVAQSATFGVALWAAGCGIFCILSMLIAYRFYGKKNGMNLVERGVKIPLQKFLKTLLLAVIVISVTYSWVFFADYFFKTDFRFWVLAVKAFEPNLILTTLFPCGILFLIYYVASSVATNCFNYNTIGGKRSWVNTVVVAFITALPAIFLLAVQYFTYFSTKQMMWFQAGGLVQGNPPMYVLWLFPVVVILFAAVVISRLIYKVSRNPYIAGIVTGIIVALLSCTNTRTMVL